ncbi:SAV_915 family protein [Streptomyces clavuligerus]|nr:SAV_915 family protein [Streptomyces clavuligerus]WDN54691.1 hypothetical protein LL058_24200 [Streptomyces clavuligerus]
MDTLTREGAGAETADPDEPRPAGPLYVPVRLGSAGGRQLRFLRTSLGVRTAVGFTSPERLTAALGARQRWIRLAEPALRALAEPLGVTTVTVDPRLGAPVARRARHDAPAAPCARRAGGPGGLLRSAAAPATAGLPYPD